MLKVFLDTLSKWLKERICSEGESTTRMSNMNILDQNKYKKARRRCTID